jgi:hypothetical protein
MYLHGVDFTIKIIFFVSFCVDRASPHGNTVFWGGLLSISFFLHMFTTGRKCLPFDAIRLFKLVQEEKKQLYDLL